MDYTYLNDIIKFSKNILIVSHINPDGDTTGSMLAMYSVIKDNFKKRPDMLAVSKIPDVYKFLPNTKIVKHVDEIDKSLVYDLVINVDVASKERICDAEILFDKAKHTLNIDHHKTNISYAQNNIVDGEASSTAEILFYIFKDLGWKISYDTAICLYTAILTDTGSFRFDNTTSKTLVAVSELLKLNIPVSTTYKSVYESDHKNLVLFQAHCVGKAKFLNDDKIAYTTVYQKDMEKFGANDECMEGLTEKLRAIVTTEVAFVAKEMKSGHTKISMRSKTVDISEICGKFSGGGHKFAAGCTINSKPEVAVKKILDEIEKKVL